MKGIRLWLLGMLALSCHAAPPALSPAWLRNVEVQELGTGQCVISDERELVCENEQAQPSPGLSEPIASVASVPRGPGCAVSEGGTVACWGCAAPRVLAPFDPDGSKPRDPPPLAATTRLPLERVKQVVLSNVGACALQRSGELDCWGAGVWSKVYGDETSTDICTTQRDSVKRIAGLPQLASVAMTLDGQLCGVTGAGAVVCAGEHRFVDALGADQTEPAPAQPLLPKTRSIAAGEQHFCALGVSGGVTCWGENDYGQCGTSSEPCVENQYGSCRAPLTRVSLPERAVDVTAGARHSCAVLESGKVACWGDNSRDGLGFASTTACHPYFLGFCTPTPAVVPGLVDVRQVLASRGGVRTWALLQSGHVVAWPGTTAAPERPLGEPCRDLNGVLSSAEVVARHPELHGQRIRVRGRLSTIQVLEQRVTLMGSLALHHGPSLALGPDEELVVDGKVVNLIIVGPEQARQSLPGLNVFDLCRVPASR